MSFLKSVAGVCGMECASVSIYLVRGGIAMVRVFVRRFWIGLDCGDDDDEEEEGVGLGAWFCF